MSVQEALEAFRAAGAVPFARGPEDDTRSPNDYKEDDPIPSQRDQLNVKREFQVDPGLQNVLLVVVGAPLTYAVLKDGFGRSTGTSLLVAAGVGLAFYRGYLPLVAAKVNDLMGRVGEETA